MIFGKNKEGKVMEILGKQGLNQSYWAIVKRRFQKNKLAKWSLRVLIVIFFIALFSDFIANEKPLYCKIEGKTYFPVLKQYAVDLGWSKWETKFYQTPWQDHDYESVIMPLIPYSHYTQDKKNVQFVSPIGNQNVPSNRYWHWLGTDQFGRDVLAGMNADWIISRVIGWFFWRHSFSNFESSIRTELDRYCPRIFLCLPSKKLHTWRSKRNWNFWKRNI